MDGPYGPSAEYILDNRYVMLVAGGIGMTPFASILRQIAYNLKNKKKLKIEKIWFYW